MFDFLFLTLLYCLVIVVLFTFPDYGISWDEPIQSQYGQLIIRFFSSGFIDRSATTFKDLYLYGGMFDAPVEFLSSFSPLRQFGTRRLATVLVGILGILGCWKLARHMGGPQSSFWAALFLVLVPGYYGHMFMNPKDIPFAAGYVWSLYYLVQLAPRLLDSPALLLIKLGIVLGLTLGVRVGGVLLICYFVVLLVYHYSPHWWSRTAAARLMTHLALIFSISYILMIAFWPWVWFKPISGPLEALKATAHFEKDMLVLFRGHFVHAASLPVDYLPVYFGITLPLFFLVFFLGALPLVWREARRAHQEGNKAIASQYLLLVLAILFPILFAIGFGSTLYSGARHFLFVVPPMACLAGVTTSRFLVFVRSRSVLLYAVVLTGMTLVLGLHVRTMAQLHPYQYVYYNSLVGGVRGAAENFELDYYATSYKEAAEKLVAHVKGSASSEVSDHPRRPYRVLVCGPLGSAVFPSNEFRLARDAEEADFYITGLSSASFRLEYCPSADQGKLLASVARLGATLSVVKEISRPGER